MNNRYNILEKAIGVFSLGKKEELYKSRIKKCFLNSMLNGNTELLTNLILANADMMGASFIEAKFSDEKIVLEFCILLPDGEEKKKEAVNLQRDVGIFVFINMVMKTGIDISDFLYLKEDRGFQTFKFSYKEKILSLMYYR